MKGETGMNRNGKGPWKHDVNEGRQGRGGEQTATGAPNVCAGILVCACGRAVAGAGGGAGISGRIGGQVEAATPQTTRNCAELRWITVNCGKPKNKFVVPGARANQIIASAKMRKGS